jgi:hypothetical protein
VSGLSVCPGGRTIYEHHFSDNITMFPYSFSLIDSFKKTFREGCENIPEYKPDKIRSSWFVHEQVSRIVPDSPVQVKIILCAWHHAMEGNFIEQITKKLGNF